MYIAIASTQCTCQDISKLWTPSPMLPGSEMCLVKSTVYYSILYVHAHSKLLYSTVYYMYMNIVNYYILQPTTDQIFDDFLDLCLGSLDALLGSLQHDLV